MAIRSYKVRLLELPHDYDRAPPAPGGKPTPPVEVPGFAIDAGNSDLAREAVRGRLAAYGYTKVRSISSLVEGGFAAVVYAVPPKGK